MDKKQKRDYETEGVQAFERKTATYANPAVRKARKKAVDVYKEIRPLDLDGAARIVAKSKLTPEAICYLAWIGREIVENKFGIGLQAGRSEGPKKRTMLAAERSKILKNDILATLRNPQCKYWNADEFSDFYFSKQMQIGLDRPYTKGSLKKKVSSILSEIKRQSKKDQSEQ